MLKLLEKLKYRLSHVSQDSWHWKVTYYVFEYKAHGKTCSYYWLKLPLSILGFAVALVAYVLWVVFRILVIVPAWVFGFRFNEKITDVDLRVTEGPNWDPYKTKADGSKSRFAPWEILLIPTVLFLLWFLIFSRPDVGKWVLIAAGGLTLFITLVYFLTAGWKSPYIARARHQVQLAWDKACPPLVVEDGKGEVE